MKIPDIKKLFLRHGSKAALMMLLGGLLVLAGCNVFGFLTQPGPFEEKVPPQYDLVGQQDRKILLLIECPRSSGVDYDVKQKLMHSFDKYLRSQMKIQPENLVFAPPQTGLTLTQDPVKMARELQAGYVLLIQVDKYELAPLSPAKYFAGQIISQAVLMDTELDMAVWPKGSGGKIIHVGVDLETESREMALTRLTSTTAHCVLRYLYPCKKIGFKSADEVFTLQEAFEMETY